MGTDSLSTDTAYLNDSFDCLHSSLLTVMIIMSIRNRARNEAATELHLAMIKRGARTTQAVSTYEDVTSPSLPVGTISTQDSVTYGHK